MIHARSAIRRLKAPCGILVSRSTMPLRSPRKLKSELPGQSGPALPRTRGGFFVPIPVPRCAHPLRRNRQITSTIRAIALACLFTQPLAVPSATVAQWYAGRAVLRR
jgi:hypothetical protein